MALGRASLTAIFEVISASLRRAALWASRISGTVIRATSRGWLPVLRWIVVVAIALLVLPPVINLALDLAGTLGVWKRLEVDPEPSVGNWWTWQRVLLVAGALITLRWFVHARERVIVEEFVDYTSHDAKAVSGLAMLLVTELARLRELYGRVNEELSTPLSVGASPGGSRGGSAGEPGAFLSVRADDVTEVLSGAVASESKVTFAGFTIPIGVVLSLLGRIVRGPRVIGSVHFTEAGGGPTVTAQIVGRGNNFTWRIDASDTHSRAPDKAFLDPMVTEIGSRMFTDMTLRGSVRWQAIQAFTEYLELYWESLRTPKNRASFLKQAEGRLLAAVAEDETFDLAYYNLGVVYSQLAQAEYLAAATAEHAPKRRSSDPEVAHAARTEAARSAFMRAIVLNRGRWEAVYALAVHEFSRFRHEQWCGNGESADEQERLRLIVRRCERVLELDRRNAQACDLIGLAQVELGQARLAIHSHRRAVTRSWWRLCRAEYRERRRPPTSESVLPGARANAAAALKNLAHARFRLACDCNRTRRWIGINRADRVFHQALSLAPDSARAAMEFERGGILDEGGRRRCVGSYKAAVRVEPENPVYWAHLARAQAKYNEHGDTCVHSCGMTLETLAPVFRRTLEPHCLAAQRLARDDTIAALTEAYEQLRKPAMQARIAALTDLADGIVAAEAARPRDVRALAKLCRETADDDWWRREQLGLAMARSFGANGKWSRAAYAYGWLIATLGRRRPAAIRQHALHAKHAKALRRSGKKHEALESAARGLLLDPISAVARRELGKAHFALLQYEEALEAWQHTLWLTPNDATLHFKAGFSLWSTAQDRQDPALRTEALTEATVDFERAAELFGIENVSGWAWSRLWLGRVHGELGAYDPAVRHLRAAKGCAVTELAARIFLAEIYARDDRGGFAGYQFDKARAALVALIKGSTLSRKELLCMRCDEDWGNTLSYREIAARIQLGKGRFALASGDEEAAIDHATRARRLARGLADQPRAKTRMVADALELESRLDFTRETYADALEKAQRAALLSPTPERLLLKLTIAAACAANSVRSQEREQLVAGMASDLRAISRAEGEHGEKVAIGRLIIRQWAPEEATSANGRAAAPAAS